MKDENQSNAPEKGDQDGHVRPDQFTQTDNAPGGRRAEKDPGAKGEHYLSGPETSHDVDSDDDKAAPDGDRTCLDDLEDELLEILDMVADLQEFPSEESGREADIVNPLIRQLVQLKPSLRLALHRLEHRKEHNVGSAYAESPDKQEDKENS